MLSPTIKMKEQREPRVSGERKEAPNLSSLSVPTLWLVSNPPRGGPPHVTAVTWEGLCVPPRTDFTLADSTWDRRVTGKCWGSLCELGNGF